MFITLTHPQGGCDTQNLSQKRGGVSQCMYLVYVNCVYKTFVVANVAFGCRKIVQCQNSNSYRKSICTSFRRPCNRTSTVIDTAHKCTHGDKKIQFKLFCSLIRAL